MSGHVEGFAVTPEYVTTLVFPLPVKITKLLSHDGSVEAGVHYSPFWLFGRAKTQKLEAKAWDQTRVQIHGEEIENAGSPIHTASEGREEAVDTLVVDDHVVGSSPGHKHKQN